MSEPLTHVHISEREADGSWEDCTWDSGLEFYRDAIDPSRPATHAEAQALRAASGEPPTGGSNLGNFATGVARRYGKTIPARISAHNILTALKPGYVAAVQGSMSAFGSTHPLSKWDRSFNGSHQVWLARTPAGVLLWCDPEAPTTADVPVIISAADVTKFVNAFNGEAVVAPALKWAAAPQENPTMYPIIQSALGYTAVIKAQSNIRTEPKIAASKVRTLATDTIVPGVVGYVTGDVDPGNGKTQWLSWLEGGQWRFTAVDNVVSLKAPVAAPTVDTTPFSQAEMDAAIAKANAADALRVQAEAKAATAAETQRQLDKKKLADLL